MINDESHPISIPQLVREAPFPVYGLIGNLLELAVCSVSWGSSNTLFQCYHLSDSVRKQAGSPQVVEGTWTIAQVAFTGEIRHWS